MKRPALALLAAVLTTSIAAAEPPTRHGDDGVNVRLTLTVEGAGGAHTLRALLLEDQRTRLTSGWRVPTVTERERQSGAASMQYQDVGLGVTARARRVGADRIRTDGEIELSSIAPHDAAPDPDTGSPVVSTFRQVFDVIVDAGVATTLAEMPRLDGGSVTLTVTAEVED